MCDWLVNGCGCRCVRCQDGGCKDVGVIPCSKYSIASDWLGVECKWYFTVMSAMMNVREAGS